MAQPATTRRIKIGPREYALVDYRPNEHEVDVIKDQQRWTFAVDSQKTAELVEVFDDGLVPADDCPEWVENVLSEIGIEGIDT